MKPDADLSEGISDPTEESSWDWESPIDVATEPASSQVAVTSDTADLDVPPQHAKYLRFGVRIEYFDVISEPCESSLVAQPNAFASATDIPQSGRVAASIREIDDQLRHKAGPRKVAQLANPARGGLKVTAQDSDLTIATASSPRVRRPIGLVSRFGVAICLAAPLGYAMPRQNWVDSAPAISQAQGQAHPDPSRLFEIQANAALDMRRTAHGDERMSVELLSPDLTASQAKLGAAGAQATAARELASQDHRAAEGERARSAALQGALLESHKQIDALRTSMAAADNAREERLRNDLAAARTLDALQRIVGDARALLREATNYVLTEMPAAHLERQRTERLTRDLSRARAQIGQLEADAAEHRTKAKASLAQASGMLDDERRKSEDLRDDLAEMNLSNAALVERADAAEQERTGAVTARERVEQTTAETEQALARERAAAASTRDELKKARLERDAAERERVRAVSAKERAEQTATETAQALARERAAAVSTHQVLDKARLESDASRALLIQVARLKEALDKQREATVSLARDLAAARADNDRLRAERRSAQIEQPLKPRSGRAADTSRVKAFSQKTARSKVRNPSRIARMRSIALPYSLRPSYATLE
ncbi:hypothetical protein [Mesorhizobium sp. M9A.F.Ca.ET.002.03.1.2]|uniref:hypothetical protein n=1 Tax=Mesorhizobium sp. M9A.F.Ca.ET.002.03.1.2 TaxID=2493668 RepID=UPI001FE0EDDB|nr:hypothetical protein [Mesorhizobium sp. M9A.F.Ca.ET.002.03.1.2]